VLIYLRKTKGKMRMIDKKKDATYDVTHIVWTIFFIFYSFSAIEHRSQHSLFEDMSLKIIKIIKIIAIKNPLTILEAPFLKRRIQFKGSIEKTVAMRKALNIKTTRAIYGGIPYSHISP
jgi:hypothetical protein